MSVFRFSLRRLLAFVAFVAVGIVSLRNASYLVSGFLSIAWLVFLMVTVLGAVYRKEQRRAFWIGCCVFGWSFAVSDHLPGTKTAFNQTIHPAYDAIKWTVQVDRATAQAHAESGGEAMFSGRGLVSITFPRQMPFMDVANTLTGFVIAFVGGVVAQWFHLTRDQPAPPKS